MDNNMTSEKSPKISLIGTKKNKNVRTYQNFLTFQCLATTIIRPYIFKKVGIISQKTLFQISFFHSRIAYCLNLINEQKILDKYFYNNHFNVVGHWNAILSICTNIRPLIKNKNPEEKITKKRLSKYLEHQKIIQL